MRTLCIIAIFVAFFANGTPAHAPRSCASCHASELALLGDFDTLIISHPYSVLDEAYENETDPDARKLLEDAREAVFTRCDRPGVSLDGTRCDPEVIEHGEAP